MLSLLAYQMFKSGSIFLLERTRIKCLSVIWLLSLDVFNSKMKEKCSDMRMRIKLSTTKLDRVQMDMILSEGENMLVNYTSALRSHYQNKMIMVTKVTVPEEPWTTTEQKSTTIHWSKKNYLFGHLEFERRSLKYCYGIIFTSSDDTKRPRWTEITRIDRFRLTRDLTHRCSSLRHEHMPKSTEKITL